MTRNFSQKGALPQKFAFTNDASMRYNGCALRRRPYAGMMKLVNMLDLGSSAARLMGSSPITRTSSEIPTTVPFPASPKTALWWEFLRFPPRLASLDSRRRGSGESGGEKSISPAYSSRKTAEILVFQGLSAVFRCVQFGPDRAKISTFRHLGAGTAAGTKSGLKWADCSQTRPRLAGSRWLWRSRK